MDAVVSSAAFQRAFVAMSFFLNRRGTELTLPLESPNAAADALVESLAHESREQRAQVLANEITRIVLSLDSARAF
jgi:hypothetical protein